MSQKKLSPSQTFKGIALFTPAGDLAYCIDPTKQDRWHINLCITLQEMLGLPEPPHFLVPGYTATIDRWLDPSTKKLRTSAELYPPVQSYQPLLNAVFGTDDSVWRVLPWQEESCNPIILETYRLQFPQLWEEQDLIIHVEPNKQFFDSEEVKNTFNNSQQLATSNYVLHLFVSGHNVTTEQTLKSLHQLLEQQLRYPYTLKVIDISKHPEQAEIYQVSATPMLVRVFPLPIRRVVGEFNNFQQVLKILTTH